MRSHAKRIKKDTPPKRKPRETLASLRAQVRKLTRQLARVTRERDRARRASEEYDRQWLVARENLDRVSSQAASLLKVVAAIGEAHGMNPNVSMESPDSVLAQVRASREAALDMERRAKERRADSIALNAALDAAKVPSGTIAERVQALLDERFHIICSFCGQITEAKTRNARMEQIAEHMLSCTKHPAHVLAEVAALVGVPVGDSTADTMWAIPQAVRAMVEHLDGKHCLHVMDEQSGLLCGLLFPCPVHDPPPGLCRKSDAARVIHADAPSLSVVDAPPRPSTALWRVRRTEPVVLDRPRQRGPYAW